MMGPHAVVIMCLSCKAYYPLYAAGLECRSLLLQRIGRYHRQAAHWLLFVHDDCLPALVG